MPCLAQTMFDGGYKTCRADYELNRPLREMVPILRTWRGAEGVNRGEAMPHLNTYCRYREIERKDGTYIMFFVFFSFT